MGRVSALISQRTFRFWALSAVLVVSMAALAGGIAYGTTTTCSNPATLGGSAFEVDTNANLIVNTSGCQDWLTGGTGTGFRSGVVAKNDTASGSGDESFGEGTKEDTALPTVVDGSIPPNKSDLKAFGVYSEQGTVTPTNPTGKFLALFWTRVQDPSGTTNMDFELNQKSCGSAPTFTNCAPNHITPLRTSGDKLITYDLSRGGTQATISIRTWNGSAWGPATVISGGSNPNALGSINTTQIPGTTPPGNQSGGATNGLTTALGTLDPRTFGEASISFSALFGNNPCGSFGSAYLKSRSSDSFTAALKDFVPPSQVSISNCAGLTTEATGPVTIGSPISDTASLTEVGPTAGGTITFKAYGPDDATCSGTAAYTNTVNVSGPGNYNSGDFTPTASGTYRWTADYSGDPSNQSASSPCNAPNESSVVNPASPEITTNATESVTIGSPISDTATLSGATNNAGGTITFNLYGPNDADCSGEVAYTNTVDVTGNGDYNSGDFTPTASGTYRWTADYSGDSNNDDASSPCNAPNESSVVNPASPEITTNATESVTIGSPISDTATLSGATNNAGGTITFNLYGPDDEDCSGTAVYTNTVDVTGNGDYNSGDFTPTASGTYRWTADYSGDSNNDDASSPCNAPNESSVVNKAPANIDTAQELFPQDSATLSASAGGTPTGTVDFALYGPNDTNCSGTPVYTEENVDLTNATANTSTANTDNTSFSVNQAGSGNYKWVVEYSGDAKHDGATSACGKEAFTATIDNDTDNQ